MSPFFPTAEASPGATYPKKRTIFLDVRDKSLARWNIYIIVHVATGQQGIFLRFIRCDLLPDRVSTRGRGSTNQFRMRLCCVREEEEEEEEEDTNMARHSVAASSPPLSLPPPVGPWEKK